MKKQLALAATILTITTGCDKAKPVAAAVVDRAGAVYRFVLGHPTYVPPKAVQASIDLSRNPRPTLLFQVFGDRDHPRMLPIASVDGGRPRLIVLPGKGWRALDSLYFDRDLEYPVYRDGVRAGAVQVSRGMWESDSTLYSLPKCAVPTPMADVDLTGDAGDGSTIELLASNGVLGRREIGRAIVGPAIDERVRMLGFVIAGRQGIDGEHLARLNFRALSISTGARPGRTLVGTYVDPRSREGLDPKALPHIAQLFFLADSAAYGFNVTYSSGGTARADSLRMERYVDHLDLDGDGIDEIVLEAWTFDRSSYPVVLKFSNGRWAEIFHGRPSWCTDAKAAREVGGAKGPTRGRSIRIHIERKRKMAS